MLYDPKWEQKTDSPVKSVLIAARALIERPEGWCQTAYGLNGSVCAVIAIRHASIELTGGEGLEGDAVAVLADAMGALQRFGLDVGRWNDSHTHAEVLAAFDKAIAAVR